MRNSIKRAGWLVTLTAIVLATAATDVARRPEPPAVTPAEALPQWTQQQAYVAASRTGRPVEVTGLRDERREVYANPDGTLTQDIHQQPVRVRRAGKWVTPDATLVRVANGSVAPRAAVTDLRFSGGGPAGAELASISRAGRRYAISWPAALPAPTLTGDTATYTEVLPGVDLVLHARLDGFSHVLVLKTAAAAAELTEVTFGLHTQLLRVQAAAGGGLSMVDAGSGATVFETPTPRMWESAPPGAYYDGDPTLSAPDGARASRLAVRLGADSLTLVPDRDLLGDPATRFPVYLDPFVAGTSNESWAMVDSGYPTDEYWKFAGDADERVGYCPVGVAGQVCNSSRIKRLFYVLPTSFAGMTILDAKFRVTQQHTYDSTPRAVSLYRAGSGGALITSATNWGNMPGGSGMAGFVKQQTISPTGTTGCETGATRNVEFNAIEAVQTAATYGWSKTTFLIRTDNESSYLHLKRFCNNAVLSVTYNRAPYQPAASALTMSPGGACVTGTSRPYVSSLPQLKATLTDPDTADAEPLTAEFKVTWTPAGGSLQTKSWTSPQLANGSTFTYNLADVATGTPSLPQNVVTRWQVRASDGTATGAWSPTCEFMLDTTRPSGPDIDSAEYLPSDAPDTTPSCVESATWMPGVGRYGTFTFDSAATDVNAYRYGFDTNPQPANQLTPATDGGPVTLRWLPTGEGPHTVNVVAVDRAGKQSDISSCTFRVAAGTGPVAEWRLDDAAGATAALDTAGGHQAVAGSAVVFGVPGPGGAADRAVRFSNSTSSYLATTDKNFFDTGRAVTLSAWVRITDRLRYQVVLSVDGSAESTLRIGYNPAGGGRWFATAPSNDINSLGSWTVNGPTVVEHKWTHLAVVFDPVQQTMSMSVDGGAAVSARRGFAWTARGAVQIGRRFIRPGVYGDSFTGDIADLRVYDRVLTAGEITGLPHQLTSRLGYWDLDGATLIDDQPPLVGRSSGYGPTVELEPALELGLYTGATHYRRLSPEEPGYDPFAPSPLVGDGHLVLDGGTGYAATTGPVAVTGGSFSVAARVQLATDCTTAPMTLLSQPGAHASGFDVGCAPDGAGGAKWRVVVPGTDDNAPVTVVATGDALRPDPSASGGQFLVATYDAVYRTLRLYVDGTLIGTATDVPTTWAAGAGGLQIGRALVGSTWTQQLAGIVDEVRVYTGVLDPVTIMQLNVPNAVPDL
ncbi:LamG-like jellyroll fold domain-containing protein [Dactylosporangium sp. NPDC049742]|uniref:LamG-like jellyroll fold domain-containing protein n=1 Tax=Dactylosporangium sp. NPDC049742 TaxID=3154737 RepID=UPI0034204F30